MIAIVDYGLGNVNAFAAVYKILNIPSIIAKQVEDLKNASKLILPGVGAFDPAMHRLEKSGMRQFLDEIVLHRHVAGIRCLCWDANACLFQRRREYSPVLDG